MSNSNVTPTYGELVAACAAFGIRRSRAYTLAATGWLTTFKVGRKRYVYLDSIRHLPELAGNSGVCTCGVRT